MATFVQRGFYPDFTITITATELEILKTSAKDLEILKTSANTLQKRINHLRMHKFNFVRGRTGIFLNLNTFRKM